MAAFNMDQFKETMLTEFERLHGRIDVTEDRVQEIAVKLIETDKEAVRLRAVYESDHMPKVDIESRIRTLEVKVTLFSAIGSILGAAIVTAVFKLLGA